MKKVYEIKQEGHTTSLTTDVTTLRLIILSAGFWLELCAKRNLGMFEAQLLPTVNEIKTELNGNPPVKE